MIRYNHHTLLDLTSNFFEICTDLKVYFYNYSKWVQVGDGKGYWKRMTISEVQKVSQ